MEEAPEVDIDRNAVAHKEANHRPIQTQYYTYIDG